MSGRFDIKFSASGIAWVYLLLFLALVSYIMPWTSHQAASLSMTAFDLAEWTSLHPVSRNASPPFVAALLLRLQILLCLWIFVICSAMVSRNRFASRSAMIGLSAFISALAFVSVLPPLEFFQDFADGNYRQQFVLAVILVAGALICWTSTWRGWHGPFIVVISAGGLVSAAISMSSAMALLETFSFGEQYGAGFMLYSGFMGALAFTALLKQARQLWQSYLA